MKEEKVPQWKQDQIRREHKDSICKAILPQIDVGTLSRLKEHTLTAILVGLADPLAVLEAVRAAADEKVAVVVKEKLAEAKRQKTSAHNAAAIAGPPNEFSSEAYAARGGRPPPGSAAAEHEDAADDDAPTGSTAIGRAKARLSDRLLAEAARGPFALSTAVGSASKATVGRALRDLVAAGKLVVTGQRRSARYSLPGMEPPPAVVRRQPALFDGASAAP